MWFYKTYTEWEVNQVRKSQPWTFCIWREEPHGLSKELPNWFHNLFCTPPTFGLNAIWLVIYFLYILKRNYYFGFSLNLPPKKFDGDLILFLRLITSPRVWRKPVGISEEFLIFPFLWSPLLCLLHPALKDWKKHKLILGFK